MKSSDIAEIWSTVLNAADLTRAMSLLLQAKGIATPEEFQRVHEAAKRESQQLRDEILARFPREEPPPETGGGQIQ